MKIKANVSSDRRKNRKRHFQAPAHERWRKMSCRLSKELREEKKVKTIPVRRDDEVLVYCGKYKGMEGKVVAVDRKNYVIHIDGVQGEKKNGESYYRPIPVSKVLIQKLKMNGSRDKILQRRSASKPIQAKEEGKVDVD